MSKMCKIKRRTYRTPEYRSDVREELEELLRTYDARLPAQPDGAGIELHWESPTVVEQNGELVMVRWQDRDDQMVEELVTTRVAKRAHDG